MGMMQELAGNQHAVRCPTRRSSRSCTSAISPIRRAWTREWRAYFDELRGGDARATSRMRRSSSRSASSRATAGVAGAMVDATHHAQAGAGAAPHQQVPHAGHARRRPRSAQAPGTRRLHRRPRPRDVRLLRGRHGHRVRRRLATRRGRSACGCATSSRRCRRRTRARSAPSTCTSPTRRPSASSRSGWSRSARGPTIRAEQRKHILERLTAAETLERYLHTKYVGQKRFSLRGRRHADPDARPADRAARARRACRRS